VEGTAGSQGEKETMKELWWGRGGWIRLKEAGQH
jgi:hypothetical protein